MIVTVQEQQQRQGKDAIIMGQGIKVRIDRVTGSDPMGAGHIERADQQNAESHGRPHIDPARFDALVAGAERIWGKGAIAQALGLSESTVKRLAERDDVPIYRPGGRYFAYRSELIAWLHTKPAAKGGVVLNFVPGLGTGGGTSAR